MIIHRDRHSVTPDEAASLSRLLFFRGNRLNDPTFIILCPETEREKELAAAIRRAACELDRWADDMIADGALFGSHEDALAARLRSIAAGLMAAFRRHPDEPDLAA